MASSVISLSSSSNEADTLNRNSTSQISKLKINVNDVVVTGDSIQSLISPGALNKSNQINTIILSDNLDLAKTFNKDPISSNNETISTEISLADTNEANNNINKQQQQPKFKIRYHYNSYSNYQNYNEEHSAVVSNICDSDSDSAATSPILSNDDSNDAASPTLISNFSNLDPLSTTRMENEVQNAFKFSSSILNVNESTDDGDVKTIIKPTNTNRLTQSSTNETLRRHYYHSPQATTTISDENKDLIINGKSIEVFPADETIKQEDLLQEQQTAVKKEKKRVSFNDSLLQVHLIPNLSSASSLSIEKFKYQLKTTTITMENNDNIDEDNEIIDNYDQKYTTTNNNNLKDSTNNNNNKINFSFYKPNETNNSISVNDENSTKTYLLSSSLISSLQNNNNETITNNSSIIPNSKLYRTTLFKTFQDTSNDTIKSENSSLNPNTKRISSGTISRENSFIRNNSAHFKTDMKNLTESSVNNNSKLSNNNKKKETNFRIGSSSISSSTSSSSTSSSSSNNYNPLINYQNQRSYSSILASTFSSNYSFTKHNPHVQIQLQSNNLSIPFHASPLMPSTSIIVEESNNSKSASSTKRSHTPNETVSTNTNTNNIAPTKNENAILRLNSGSTNKQTTSNINKINSNSNNNTEVHQSLAMSFELTPQLKFLSNLKTPKQTANLFINSTELKDLVQEEKTQTVSASAPKEVQVQMQHNTTNRNHNNDTLSAPIIANLSAGLFKQKFSNKPGSTKYIFLKSDDKQEINVTPSTFSSNHYNTLNKSYSSSKVNLSSNSNNSNSTSSITTPLSNSSSSDMLKLNQELNNSRATPTVYHSTAKNLAMSTVNQLFALKDVNYYVTNSSSKAIRKYHQSQNLNNHKSSSFSKPSSSMNNNHNSSGEVTTIKLHSFTQNHLPSSATSEIRQTKSALPLLRSSIKNSSPILTNINSNNDLNQRSSSNITPTPTSSSSSNNQQIESTKNLNNCFNNLSYKLINTPMGNLTKAKTFLYNQNANNSINSMFEKRIKENSNEKSTF